MQRFDFANVDFSALNDDAFIVAASCRGLEALHAGSCVVPSRLLTDRAIRACPANGGLELDFFANTSGGPYAVSEDAILDFLLPRGR